MNQSLFFLLNLSWHLHLSLGIPFGVNYGGIEPSLKEWKKNAPPPLDTTSTLSTASDMDFAGSIGMELSAYGFWLSGLYAGGQTNTLIMDTAKDEHVGNIFGTFGLASLSLGLEAGNLYYGLGPFISYASSEIGYEFLYGNKDSVVVGIRPSYKAAGVRFRTPLFMVQYAHPIETEGTSDLLVSLGYGSSGKDEKYPGTEKGPSSQEEQETEDYSPERTYMGLYYRRLWRGENVGQSAGCLLGAGWSSCLGPLSFYTGCIKDVWSSCIVPIWPWAKERDKGQSTGRKGRILTTHQRLAKGAK